MHVDVVDIVMRVTGCLLNLLNTSMVLFKKNTDKNTALLPERHKPGSEGHTIVPEGLFLLLLAQAS